MGNRLGEGNPTCGVGDKDDLRVSLLLGWLPKRPINHCMISRLWPIASPTSSWIIYRPGARLRMSICFWTPSKTILPKALVHRILNGSPRSSNSRLTTDDAGFGWIEKSTVECSNTDVTQAGSLGLREVITAISSVIEHIELLFVFTEAPWTKYSPGPGKMYPFSTNKDSRVLNAE